MCLHSVGWLLGAGCFKNASLICLVIGANWCLTLLSTQAQCSKKISAEAIRLPDAPLRSCTKSLPLVKVYHKAKPKSRAGKRDCFLQDAAKNLRSIFFFNLFIFLFVVNFVIYWNEKLRSILIHQIVIVGFETKS